MKKKLLTLMASIMLLSFLFIGCVNKEENEKEKSDFPQTNTYEWQQPPAKVRPDGNGGTIKEDADGNIIDIENADGTKG